MTRRPSSSKTAKLKNRNNIMKATIKGMTEIKLEPENDLERVVMGHMLALEVKACTLHFFAMPLDSLPHYAVLRLKPRTLQKQPEHG